MISKPPQQNLFLPPPKAEVQGQAQELVRYWRAINRHRLGIALLVVAVGVLASFAEHRAADVGSREELEQIGVALVRLDPARAIETFGRWCSPPGFLRRITLRPRPLVFAALAGLAGDPRVAAGALLEVLVKDYDARVRREARAARENREQLLTALAAEAPRTANDGS
ncbi:MAG: hypothetical protein WCJ30_26865 [Deltaproteobacteria bacterium]